MDKELKAGDRVRIIPPDPNQSTSEYCLIGKEGLVRHYNLRTKEALVSFGGVFSCLFDVHRSRLELIQEQEDKKLKAPIAEIIGDDMSGHASINKDDTMRDTDPLKWQALQGCDWIESIPISEFRDATSKQAFVRMRNMAKFIRREIEKGTT